LFDSNTGRLLQTFNNPTPADSDNFGYSVAGVGTNALIGAPFKTVGGVTQAGAAYLFNSNTGALLQTFNKPNPRTNDQFGSSVAGVGNNALIGAVFDDTGATDAGSAYLFNGSTGALLQTFNNPNPTANAQFSRSVAGVGNNVLVGTPGANSAYLFDSNTGTLLQTFQNTDPSAPREDFGFSVAGTGTNVFIGAEINSSIATNAGAAYAISLDTPVSLTQLTFGNNPSQSVTIAPSAITAITNTGTDVVMQANNDITVKDAITTNSLTGRGGGLTLEAGRSLLIDADITTDNGNLTLIANQTAANGVSNSDRDPGNAVISVAPGVTLNSGRGDTVITLNTGTGLSNNSSGDITLGDVIAGSLLVENNGLNGGNIDTSAGTLNTSSSSGDGGGITLTADGNITTGSIDTSSTGAAGNGGEIQLTSQTGEITTGNLNSSGASNGGNITVNASTQITTGRIDSSGVSGKGGDVSLDPSGDIQVAAINAQGGTRGGTINIFTQGFFRATDSFLASDGQDASISSAGGSVGGTITIQHGGKDIFPLELVMLLPMGQRELLPEVILRSHPCDRFAIPSTGAT
jgi:hypothetical protein